jgi:hypothetical protein
MPPPVSPPLFVLPSTPGLTQNSKSASAQTSAQKVNHLCSSLNSEVQLPSLSHHPFTLSHRGL